MPEKVAALFFFFLFGAGCEDRFEGVGMQASIINFGGEGHGSGGEILDLLEFEVEFAGFGSEVGHVGFATARVGGNEIGNQLLAAWIGVKLAFVL